MSLILPEEGRVSHVPPSCQVTRSIPSVVARTALNTLMPPSRLRVADPKTDVHRMLVGLECVVTFARVYKREGGGGMEGENVERIGVGEEGRKG